VNPHSWLITGFVTRLTRRVPLVEQELFTRPEHLSSPPHFSGLRITQSLVLYVCFVDRCLSFCSFKPNLTTVYWSVCAKTEMWVVMYMCVQNINVASVSTVIRLESRTVPIMCYSFYSNCSLCCLFFFDIRILITSLVFSNSSPVYICLLWW
jgi:hypothetical protein